MFLITPSIFSVVSFFVLAILSLILFWKNPEVSWGNLGVTILCIVI